MIEYLTNNIAPEWYHPYFDRDPEEPSLSMKEMQVFAYSYYLRFLLFFKNQPEGSISPGVELDFSNRLKNKMGMAYLFEGKIKLNAPYFLRDPRLLPYTLFHELVHLWLYDSYLDPGHTWRFYEKMKTFESTGLPVDRDVHIHKRKQSESKFILCCTGCNQRWFLKKLPSRYGYCGQCFQEKTEKRSLNVFRNPLRTDLTSYTSKELKLNTFPREEKS